MFSILGPITITLLLASTICQALPDLHKQMSPEQLHSVFHVDTHDAVPEYELVQLLHHTPQAGLQRRRRSIGESLSVATSPQPPHHVKKDLSKNSYYSELKQKAAAGGGGNNLLGADISDIKAHNVSFSAFGRHMNLTLRATQGLFKGAPHELRMWSVGSEPNATHGLDMQEILNEEHHKHEIGEVFQDEHNMAAILMRRHMETGDLIMEGSIGHDLVIKPLPHELSNNKEQAQHVVYKREASATDDQLSDFAFMEPDDLLASEKLERLQRRQRRRRRSAANSPDFEDLNDEDEGALDTEAEAEPQTSESRVRPRRQAPYVIYPEVLVIVDYDGYRLHGGDNLQVKRYFISFWNGVDLRYRLLKGPRIRISIAGIIISRGRDATPYLERNRVGRDAIDSAAALTDMGKYLFRERRLPVYDIAVAITKYDMCRRRKGGRCTKGTAGFAYVGGACVVNKRLEKVNSVAIIEDTGGFSGIIVAAHEVGHLLGAVHDGSPPPSYLGGPGAQRCRWEDGYIMSDLRHTERGFRWSACTVQSFHHFLNGDTATCLHNAPHEDSALGRSLPGTLLSLDAQCRRDRGTYACFKDERVCAQLFCFDAQTGYCVAYRPAAEGSACGNGYHCLDGRCTPLPSNIIPDYGNNYRLVYNKISQKNDASSETAAEDVESSSEETESQEDDENEDEDEREDERDDDQNDGITSSEELDINQQDNNIQQSSAAAAAAEAVIETTTTTTTTTKRPKTFEYLRRLYNTDNYENSALSNTHAQWPTNGQVVVKTYTSSSVSSSSGSSSSSHHTTTTTTTPRTTTTQTPNIFQFYTHELRKQLEYYFHLLQTQQQPQEQHQQHQQQQHQLQPQQSQVVTNEHFSIPLVQKQITNYSATTNSNNSGNTNTKEQNNSNGGEVNNKRQQQQQQQQQQQVDEENEANAGIEINEAIERQKRKFLIQQQQQQPRHLTTLQQQQQQHQQQPLATPTTSTATATAATAKASPTATATSTATTSSTSKSKATTTLFDAYFKKLQALHLPTLDGAVTATTTSVSTSVSSSAGKASNTQQQQQQHQQQQQQPQQNFDGSSFLKLVNWKLFPF
ncbi:LOW QUALITY PROTEIN: A disintegrin and metalloproteinase with thrombospondin motifs like [Drosophila nasuta]|uniref:LOW QUALITY PROTEIN: A disintegrin and metalloproteinase with thrombospondin motifs like n=1 Tax=Drosophila nasuta TaxID=42062 RepID=UPI00295EAA92|nr:LOW QUALITY PROTEIN: A disintegrin and metalloproteinase with thrombospondin motifs like [Drosophila nasuta]